MRTRIAVVAGAATLALVGYVDGRSDREDARRSGAPISYASQRTGGQSGSALERLERSIKMKPGSKKALGAFVLRSGRRVQLYTAETTDAKSCLVEDDTEAGAGAGCLDGGLFRSRKVAFSVNTDGGPDRFAELYVIGVVAPSVRSANLVLTDGREIELRLASERAFVFESSGHDLSEEVYPTSFRLFGPSGKLIEIVSFPSAG